MANGFYQPGLKHFAWGDIVWKASGGSTIRAYLIDTADYTVNLTTHDAIDDVAAAAREENGALTLIDAADDGVLDANDITYVGTAGDQCEGVLVAKDSGVEATSWLLFWWDSGSGLPVTLGGDVTVSWGNVAGTLLARI